MCLLQFENDRASIGANDWHANFTRTLPSLNTLSKWNSILHFRRCASVCYSFMKMTAEKFRFRSKYLANKFFFIYKILISFYTQMFCKNSLHIFYKHTNPRCVGIGFGANGFLIYCQIFINPIEPTHKMYVHYTFNTQNSKVLEKQIMNSQKRQAQQQRVSMTFCSSARSHCSNYVYSKCVQ